MSNELQKLLRLRAGSSSRLESRESARLEFKEQFNIADRAAYARIMASFANAHGGYLVFGVKNSPRELVGLKGARFDDLDPATLTVFLDSGMSPALAWEIDSIDLAGFRLGFIYTNEALEKPVVCTTNERDLKEGEIYYRYHGQTRTIRPPELFIIIQERIDRERRAWMQLTRRISLAGPTNVGIIDTVEGKVFGGGAPFLIDEELVKKLKFIMEGSFLETAGEPTLRLVGDLQPVAEVGPIREVPAAIHFEDIARAFLTNRRLNPLEARTFLQESLRQKTPYVPVHFFIRKSTLRTDEVLSELDGTTIRPPSLKESLRDRILGRSRVEPVGRIAEMLPVADVSSASGFLSQYESQSDPRSRRSLLVSALISKPPVVEQSVGRLGINLIVEAITNLPCAKVADTRSSLQGLLLALLSMDFDQWAGPVRTTYRKALAHLDECLNPVSGRGSAFEKLKIAFPELHREMVSDHAFRFRWGATIYVRKGNVDRARILRSCIGNFPNGEALRL